MGSKWIRNALGAGIAILCFGTCLGGLGFSRMAKTASTLPAWQSRARDLELPISLDELKPTQFDRNAAEAYRKKDYAAAAKIENCWFDLQTPSARHLRDFEPLRLASHAKEESIRLAALQHATQLPFREALVVRLEGERRLLTAAGPAERKRLIARLGPLPDLPKSLRGELARDLSRLDRKWGSAPMDLVTAYGFLEVRLTELWVHHYGILKAAKTPEEAAKALKGLDDDIADRRFLRRFARRGYRQVADLLLEVHQLRTPEQQRQQTSH